MEKKDNMKAFTLTYLTWPIRIAIFVLTTLLLLILHSSVAHAEGGFTFSPIGGSYNVGDAITVSIRENSGSEQTNAVRAEFTYPADLLQYVTADASGSNFTVVAREVGRDGSVSFHRGSTTPVSGDQLVARAIFKVVKSGTAVLNFKDSTIAVSSKDNATNVAKAKANVSYTLTAPAAPAPAPTASPAAPVTSTTQPRSVTRVTPITGSNTPATPIELIDNDIIELETPIDVQPATLQPDGISKVEYYLDGKLVKTVAVAPFKYRLDTTKLLNGKYRLTTKTYYTNGQTETVGQTIVVKNPFGWTQFRLLVQKYILVILLLIFILIGVVVVWIIRRNVTGGGNSPYSGVDSQYISPLTPAS